MYPQLRSVLQTEPTNTVDAVLLVQRAATECERNETAKAQADARGDSAASARAYDALLLAESALGNARKLRFQLRARIARRA